MRAPARVSPRRDGHVRRSQAHRTRPDRSGLCAQHREHRPLEQVLVRGEDGASALSSLALAVAILHPAGAPRLRRASGTMGRARHGVVAIRKDSPTVYSDRCCSSSAHEPSDIQRGGARWRRHETSTHLGGYRRRTSEHGRCTHTGSAFSSNCSAEVGRTKLVALDIYVVRGCWWGDACGRADAASNDGRSRGSVTAIWLAPLIYLISYEGNVMFECTSDTDLQRAQPIAAPRTRAARRMTC